MPSQRLVRGHSTYVPVHVMRELFADYSKVLRGSEHFPAHARVAVDVSGTLYDNARHPEVFLLEASMFEDMAALFNVVASDSSANLDHARPKSEIKTQTALHRAVILAALHFVEAYVNGVALEHVLTKGSAVDDRIRDVLSDWDSSRNRPRYLSLGEKLLQYQRIILGVEHAPLQESNCPEMATILNVAKRVRDALAHPSAAANPSTFRPEKELAIATLGFKDVTEAVDAAIALVRKLGVTLYGEQALLWWLYDRATEGRFPNAAFQ